MSCIHMKILSKNFGSIMGAGVIEEMRRNVCSTLCNGHCRKEYMETSTDNHLCLDCGNTFQGNVGEMILGGILLECPVCKSYHIQTRRENNMTGDKIDSIEITAEVQENGIIRNRETGEIIGRLGPEVDFRTLCKPQIQAFSMEGDNG